MNKYNFCIDVSNVFNLNVVVSAETQEKAGYMIQRALSNIKVTTEIEEGMTITCEFKENLSKFKDHCTVEQFFTKKAVKSNKLDGRYCLIDSSVENKKIKKTITKSYLKKVEIPDSLKITTKQGKIKTRDNNY